MVGLCKDVMIPRTGSDPNGIGNPAGELRRFTRAGMDGVFSDRPKLRVAALRHNGGVDRTAN